MASFPASQVSFAGGEVSPRLAGRVDSDLYRRSLARCENFEPLPQGPMRMRCGSRHMVSWAEAVPPRLFQLRVSDETSDYVVAAGDTYLRLYSPVDGLISFKPNLIINGGFDSSTDGWTTSSVVDIWKAGSAELQGHNPATEWIEQLIAVASGHTYRIIWKAKREPGTVFPGLDQIELLVGGATVATMGVTTDWLTGYFDHVSAITGAVTIRFRALSTTNKLLYLDDVVVFDMDSTPGTTAISPWSADELPRVQSSQELSKDRMFLAHREVQTEVISFPNRALAPDVVSIYAATFRGGPATWAGSSWPGVVECGYQGRLWLAGSATDPHTLWGSKSGVPFDFDLGTGLDSDGVSVVVSAKGRVEWLQGQRVLLAGSDSSELSISGGQSIITASNIGIEESSAYGSSPVQAVHVGDQVLFVTGDRRKVRALDYSWEKQSWFSRAITWHAENIIDSDITEIHFARTPDPLIIAVLASGELRACTYDRAEGVAAWWRLTLASGSVHSACVARTSAGDDLWLSVVRDGITYIERMPLYEDGAVYLDAAATGTVPVGGVITGLSHLAGKTVRVVVDGQVLDTQVVTVGGTATVSTDYEGGAYVVGLPFTATATTLSLADPTQTSKRRRTKVRLRLNDSAIPMVNGQRAPERLPADPMNTGTDLTTGDVDYQVLGWDDGVLTITQDVPLRTEVLAIFSAAQAGEV